MLHFRSTAGVGVCPRSTPLDGWVSGAGTRDPAGNAVAESGWCSRASSMVWKIALGERCRYCQCNEFVHLIAFRPQVTQGVENEGRGQSREDRCLGATPCGPIPLRFCIDRVAGSRRPNPRHSTQELKN
jgi:hypothetical protein